MRYTIPQEWTKFRDKVSDNFRVMTHESFRVLKWAQYKNQSAGCDGMTDYYGVRIKERRHLGASIVARQGLTTASAGISQGTCRSCKPPSARILDSVPIA